MITAQYLKNSTLVLTVFSLLTGSPVSAQQDSADAAEDPLDVIVVTGVRGSIAKALDRKRNSANIVDSIEAEDIGRFPDLNLAESLQRVPGVTLERSISGENRTLTVRGLSSQFTLVTLNGMTGGSGGGGRAAAIDPSFSGVGSSGRNFSFSILPSELFTSAVVTKSPQASDQVGGVAATIKMLTPDPLRLDEPLTTATVQANYGEASGTTGRYSAIFSRKLSDKFGILLAGVYSEPKSDVTSIGSDNLVGFDDGLGNAAQIPVRTGILRRFRETENTSGLVTLSFMPSDSASFRFDALYADSSGDEFENETRVDLGGLGSPTTFVVENGVAVAADFPSGGNLVVRQRADGVDDTMQQFTLAGDIALGANQNWTLEPFVGYNKREIARQFFDVNHDLPSNGFSYDLRQGLASFSTPASDLISNPQDIILSNVLQANNAGTSDELAVKADLIRNFESGVIEQLRFGVRYGDATFKTDEPFRGVLNFNPTTPPLSNVIGVAGFDSDVPGSPTQIFVGNPVQIANTLLGGQDLFDPNFDISQTALSGIVIGNVNGDRLSRSTVTEKTLAAYVEVDAQFERLFVNAGIRVVRSDTRADGAENVSNVVSDVSFDSDDTEVLPALNLRYEVDENIILRGTYSSSFSRPALGQLAPRETFNFNTLTGSRGNPALEPFVVDQFDIGAEWYFHPEGLLGFTYFEKDFSSIIGQDTVVLTRIQESTGGAPIEQEITFSQPVNTGNAQISGVEFTAQSSFFFLPEAFHSAGVIFNYTDLDSEAEVDTSIGSQPLPFPNLSPSSYNLGLYYDNGVFDARLNYAWREGFVLGGLDPDGPFPYQDDFGQLDLTTNFRLGDHFTLQIQATNLTNEAMNFSGGASRRTIAELNLERRIVVGARFEF